MPKFLKGILKGILSWIVVEREWFYFFQEYNFIRKIQQ